MFGYNQINVPTCFTENILNNIISYLCNTNSYTLYKYFIRIVDYN